LELFPEIDVGSQSGPLLKEFLGSFVVIPEVGLEGLLLDLGEAGDLGV